MGKIVKAFTYIFVKDSTSFCEVKEFKKQKTAWQISDKKEIDNVKRIEEFHYKNNRRTVKWY